MADNVPGAAACQCHRIHHYRNPCHNPSRYCNWCKDGGCAVARRAEASAIRDEARREGAGSSSRGGGGGFGPPGFLGMPTLRFPHGPFGPPEIRMMGGGGESDDEDDDEFD